MSNNSRQPTPSTSVHVREPASRPQHSFPRAEDEGPLVHSALPTRTRKTALPPSSRPPQVPQTPKAAHAFAKGLPTPTSISTSSTAPDTPRNVASSPIGGPYPQAVGLSPSPPQDIVHPSIHSQVLYPTLQAAYLSPLHQAANEGRQHARIQQAQAATTTPSSKMSGSPSTTTDQYFTAHHTMPPPSTARQVQPDPLPPYPTHYVYPSPSNYSTSSPQSASPPYEHQVPLKPSLKRRASTELTAPAAKQARKPSARRNASKMQNLASAPQPANVPYYLGEPSPTSTSSPTASNHSRSSHIDQVYTAPVAGPSSRASNTTSASRKRKHEVVKDEEDDLKIKIEPMSPALPKRRKLAPEPQAASGALVRQNATKRRASGASNKKHRSPKTEVPQTPLPQRSPTPDTGIIELVSDSVRQALEEFPEDPNEALALLKRQQEEDESFYPASTGTKDGLTLTSRNFVETAGPGTCTVGQSRSIKAVVGNVTRSVTASWSESVVGPSRSGYGNAYPAPRPGRVRVSKVQTKNIPITKVENPDALQNIWETAVDPGHLLQGNVTGNIASSFYSGDVGVELDMSQAPVTSLHTTYEPPARQSTTQASWNVDTFWQENLPAPLLPVPSPSQIEPINSGQVIVRPRTPGHGWEDSTQHAHTHPDAHATPVAPSPGVLPEYYNHTLYTPVDLDPVGFFNTDTVAFASTPFPYGGQPGNDVFPMPPGFDPANMLAEDGSVYMDPSKDKSNTWKKTAYGSVRLLSAMMNYDSPANYATRKSQWHMYYEQVTPPGFLAQPKAQPPPMLSDYFLEQMGSGYEPVVFDDDISNVAMTACNIIEQNAAAKAGSASQPLAGSSAQVQTAEQPEEDLTDVMLRILGDQPSGSSSRSSARSGSGQQGPR